MLQSATFLSNAFSAGSFRMNSWPFVIGAYAIFFLAFASDVLFPVLRRRRLLVQLDSRWRRDQTRTAKRESP